MKLNDEAIKQIYDIVYEHLSPSKTVKSHENEIKEQLEFEEKEEKEAKSFNSEEESIEEGKFIKLNEVEKPQMNSLVDESISLRKIDFSQSLIHKFFPSKKRETNDSINRIKERTKIYKKGKSTMEMLHFLNDY